jgi:hypothetical protein
MTNLNDIYQGVLTKLGKDAYGGVLSPPLFNRLIDYVNIDMLNDRLLILEKNQNVQEDLRPFNVVVGDGTSEPLITKPNQGYVTGAIPDNFVRFVTARVATYVNKGCEQSSFRPRYVEMLSNSDFRSRLSSALRFPSIRRPIATIEDDDFLFAPDSIKKVSYTYIRRPKTPFFDFDVINGQPVYLPPNEFHANGNPSLSVELEWFVDVWPEFIERTYQQAAINIKSGEDLKMIKPMPV